MNIFHYILKAITQYQKKINKDEYSLPRIKWFLYLTNVTNNALQLDLDTYSTQSLGSIREAEIVRKAFNLVFPTHNMVFVLNKCNKIMHFRLVLKFTVVRAWGLFAKLKS